tara:strand:- start:22 stop:261 length:240 start_codon:yes stop_codon:yes gene_type:complete
MKKIFKTLNRLINYLFQIIKINFLLLINHFNKKDYLNIFNLKEKHLFVKENFFNSKKFKKNLYLTINLIMFEKILIIKI